MKCNFCNKEISDNVLPLHKTRCKKNPDNQTKKEEFKCEFCGKSYKTEDGLKKHIEKEHKDKK